MTIRIEGRVFAVFTRHMVDLYQRIKKQWAIITEFYPWHFIAFLILASFIPQLYTISNLFWIGRISQDALVITEQYEFMVTVLEILLNTIPVGVLALVAQNYHNQKKIMEIVKAGLILQVALSLSVTIIFIFFNREGIALIGTPLEIVDQTRDYLMLRSIAFPLDGIAYLLLVALKSLKKGKDVFILIAFSVILNMVLDLFMISNTPVSLNMGISGVAISFLLTKSLLLVIALAWLIHILEFNISSLITTSWCNQVVPLFRIGSWSGLETAIRMISYLWILAILNGLGKDEYAGFGLALWMIWIFFMPISAVGTGTSVLVGNFLGEKRYGDLRNILKTSIVLAIAFSLTIAITGFLWWHQVSLFLNPDPAIAGLSDTVFVVGFIGFIGYCLRIVLRSVFYGTGKTRYILYITCITNIGIIIPFCALTLAGIITPTYTMVVGVYLVVYVIEPIIAYLLVRKVMSAFPDGNCDAVSPA